MNFVNDRLTFIGVVGFFVLVVVIGGEFFGSITTVNAILYGKCVN